jgi:hypothetical protein
MIPSYKRDETICKTCEHLVETDKFFYCDLAYTSNSMSEYLWDKKVFTFESMNVPQNCPKRKQYQLKPKLNKI